MNWKDYSSLRESHAFLSASKFHWLRYTPEKLRESYSRHTKAKIGTELHWLASKLIEHKRRQPDTADSFNAFVNDAIGFRMESERVLFYSSHCYGTADAISFRDGVLRIHDLKTGLSSGNMDQLMIYAALFCLDYPAEAVKEIYLRIYQNGEILRYEPSYNDVADVMKIIIEFSAILDEMIELQEGV